MEKELLANPRFPSHLKPEFKEFIFRSLDKNGPGHAFLDWNKHIHPRMSSWSYARLKLI